MKPAFKYLIAAGLILPFIATFIGWWFAKDDRQSSPQMTTISQKVNGSSDQKGAGLASAQKLVAKPAPAAVPASEDEQEQESDSDIYMLDSAAVESLRASMSEGDNRMPALSPSIERVLPTQEELEDFAAYEEYEQNQNRQTYRAYVLAAREKANFLREMIDLAKQDGLPEEQIREGEEKLRRIEMMEAELLSQYPDLIDAP